MKRTLPLLVFLLSFLVSCADNAEYATPSETEKEQYNMKIWAHRGCCYAWPENTLQSFKAACELEGLTGIELDIQLTKDGKIVVIHDEKVDRTTNGTGNVRDFTLAELKKLKIETHPGFLGMKRYTQIPTIEEVFDLVKPYCLSYGLKINIELKNSIVRYEGMEEKILALVHDYGLEPYIVYSSFNPDSIVLIREKNPLAEVGILNPSLKECLVFAENHEVNALHPGYNGRDVENVREKTSLPIRMWNFPPDVPFYPATGAFSVPDFGEISEYGITDVFSNIPEAYLKKRGVKLSSKSTSVPKLKFDLYAEIAKSSGLYKTCGTNRMADFHFYEVNPGDSFDFDAKGYEYQIAFYDDAIDGRYIHTYCYSDEENWATYTNSIKRLHWKSHGHKFKKHGWARIVVRKKTGLFARLCSYKKLTRPTILTADDKAFVEVHCHFARQEIPYQEKPWFTAEIADTAQKVASLKSDDTLVFGLLTDNHYVINGHWEDTAYNLRAVHEKSPFDAVLHLGDFTDGMTPIAITKEYTQNVFADLKSLGVPVYVALGNHDSNYFRNNPQSMDVTQQSEWYLQREEPYYYVDFAEKKLRVLFLYSFDHTQVGQNNRYGFPAEEVDWVSHVLDETPADYKVLVLAHVPLLAEMHFWSTEIRNSEELIAVFDAYLNRGGGILGYIHGHVHADHINRDHRFPVIAIGCAKVEDEQEKKAPGSTTYPRAVGDVTQELWDVLVVNTKTGRLDFVRFGAGEDRRILYD